MIRPWQRERTLFLLLLAAGISGLWWSPWPFLPLAVIALGLLARQLWLARRLHRDLCREDPEGHDSRYNLWDSINRLVLRQRRRRQSYQRRLMAITDRIQDSTSVLQDAVIMVDRHGSLEWWNLAAEKFLGLRSPVDVNQPITNLIRAPEFARYFEACDYETPFTMSSPVRHDLHLEFNITLFGRNDRLLVIHDISRLHKLEQMRKDFIANVSHELRTPLTVIRGYLETFDQLCGELPERSLRILRQMEEQAARMDALVRDLLALSRLETRTADKASTVDVVTLLEQITEEALALSEGRHQIRLSIECDHDLTGFETELRSAFTNLIVNAVKYSPDGGRIDIRWYEDDQGIHMSVSDQGIGIDEHHIPRLTERFYRADPSRSKATGGTGLGLAIVKHVLLRHNGQLDITSTPGQGSCFTASFSPDPASQRTFAIKRESTSSLSWSSST